MPVDVTREADRSHVAHLTIDFDDLNLLTPARIEEIYAAVQEVPSEVAVLTISAPPGTDEDVGGLTAGLDITEARDFSAHDGWDVLQGLYRAMQAIRDLTAVTVCSCGEYTLGGGFELAIACDFRIATPDAQLGLPEVNVGLPTVIMGGLLTRLVGLQTAKELIYTGKSISGARASDLGIVNDTAAPGAYEDALAELVDCLATKSPLVLQWQSYIFQHWRSIGLETGMKHSIGVGARVFGTHDHREAMTAFLEDRDPAFTGH